MAASLNFALKNPPSADISSQGYYSRIHINRGEWFSPISQSILNRFIMKF